MQVLTSTMNSKMQKGKVLKTFAWKIAKLDNILIIKHFPNSLSSAYFRKGHFKPVNTWVAFIEIRITFDLTFCCMCILSSFGKEKFFFSRSQRVLDQILKQDLFLRLLPKHHINTAFLQISLYKAEENSHAPLIYEIWVEDGKVLKVIRMWSHL